MHTPQLQHGRPFRRPYDETPCIHPDTHVRHHGWLYTHSQSRLRCLHRSISAGPSSTQLGTIDALVRPISCLPPPLLILYYYSYNFYYHYYYDNNNNNNNNNN